MKQIFITTRNTSLKDLFKETPYDRHADSFDVPYTLTEGELTLHILSDKIEFPNGFNIDKINDGILFHDSSSKNVMTTITEAFNQSKGGSHVAGSLHEKAFKILFSNEQNKVNQIIQLVFPTSEVILGKKLDLLHNLLVPPVDFTEVRKQWKELQKTVKSAKESDINVSLASDENALADFEKSAAGLKDAFDANYLEALRNLRDKLLVS
jgi:hypothetical protein